MGFFLGVNGGSRQQRPKQKANSPGHPRKTDHFSWCFQQGDAIQRLDREDGASRVIGIEKQAKYLNLPTTYRRELSGSPNVGAA